MNKDNMNINTNDLEEVNGGVYVKIKPRPDIILKGDTLTSGTAAAKQITGLTDNAGSNILKKCNKKD